ncbi:ORF6N domain-containing protein [Campylobacter hyointestinalis]|uniref:ORF6N domain-containing protein n=1 Tax=Campylobacter hyointestinalis TaxID=198 RepID=UPI0025539BCC|nr:ORF6N domain-containing protein [Campylobacter hyointestinalis]MDL2346107.1 ORF6N domain-containing protein [Campylobacter hyointestinalis]MDL2347847.1 ORF6N domain-containing protein [Campylobacter hyointestinalis]MDL2349590.1 ORF6N domain-containing protein [Campylobacter hyointestinalis]MDM1025735.1 ORF6N domain-containing protein [Campylobacter hyointestinalis]MDM1027595.1 ORF6N domain-containing protein [Campylobacter hyointestinalis]
MDIIKIEEIESLILEIKNQKVLLDRDVANIYGVETKRINEAVKNNPDRFPKDYIIEVEKDIKNELVENFDRFKTLKHIIKKKKDE